MLKIKSLRWGNEEDGFACGPIGGGSLVEMSFENADGKMVYISASEYDCSEMIMIADESLYELLAETEYDEANELATQMMEFEKSDRAAIEEGIKGPYCDAIKAVRIALKQWMENAEKETAEEFLNGVIDQDVDTMNIPLVCLDDEWDEDEDDDDEFEVDEDFNPMAVYGTGKNSNYSPVMVALLIGNMGGHIEKPYPCVECALADADRMWSEMPDEEKAKQERFRVSRGEFYYSMGGPLFLESELIKDYLAN